MKHRPRATREDATQEDPTRAPRAGARRAARSSPPRAPGRGGSRPARDELASGVPSVCVPCGAARWSAARAKPLAQEHRPQRQRGGREEESHAQRGATGYGVDRRSSARDKPSGKQRAHARVRRQDAQDDCHAKPSAPMIAAHWNLSDAEDIGSSRIAGRIKRAKGVGPKPWVEKELRPRRNQPGAKPGSSACMQVGETSRTPEGARGNQDLARTVERI